MRKTHVSGDQQAPIAATMKLKNNTKLIPAENIATVALVRHLGGGVKTSFPKYSNSAAARRFKAWRYCGPSAPLD
jgi:hypothetical protein